MTLVNETKAKMSNKPVILSVHVSKPMIFSGIESSASAILAHKGALANALFKANGSTTLSSTFCF